MFDFQTNTIINSVDAFKTVGDDTLVINKNHLILKKANVISILKTAYIAPEPASITYTLGKLVTETESQDTYWRLYLDLRLEGSNNFLFANDLIYKNKPLYIEFITKAGDQAKVIADTIKSTVKKYSLALYDTNLFTVSDNGTTITLTAANEFIRFKKVILEKYTTSFKDSGITPSSKKRGTLGNGHYTQLLRDVQLPTDANVRYKRLYEDEVPVLNGTYNQYIVTEKVERTLHGQGAVGQTINSVTTHNFWVKSDISNFETALGKIGTITTITPKE